MKRFESIKKKIYSTVLLLPVALMAAAQDAATNAASPQDKSNLAAILLVVVATVLAFIIWGLGQVLVSVSRLALEKHKATVNTLAAILTGVLLLSSQSGFAQAADATKAAVADAPNYGGMTAHNFYAFVGVFLLEIAAIVFLTFSIRRVYRELLPATAKVKSSALGAWWDSLDKKFFTKAVPVEKEADVLLDHNYDGIQELDNSLPPWWKYGFYATIMVAVVYLFVFHVSGEGKNPTQEYAAEMEKARIEKEAYDAKNKDKVDEKNVPMADAAGIKTGEGLFEANCVACHVKGAGGSQNPPSVGPNLTDDYWLHKGSLNDIFHTITYGYPDKGMQAWGTRFTPKEISFIASYIKSIHGTNPANAKAPQGELYTEDVKTDSAAAAKPDSTKIAAAVSAKDTAAKGK